MRRAGAVPFAIVLGAALRVGAVIVAGGDGTQNATVPPGGRGWSRVGRIVSSNGAPSSVTYVSNNWFVTAWHIRKLDKPFAVRLEGRRYEIEPASWTRLTNPDGSGADLALFRVAGPVRTPGVALVARPPGRGGLAILIGNGRNRAPEKTHWQADVSKKPPVWTEAGPAGNAAGYKWAPGAKKRWGMGFVAGGIRALNDGHGVTDVFYTRFVDRLGSAQGATYDSGGGAFVIRDGAWKLAGVMLTVSGLPGQPKDTAVFGNRTYCADLSAYRTQIERIVKGEKP